MYKSKFQYIEMCKLYKELVVRISKNSCYENPYNVIGIIQQLGLEEIPKDIY